MSENEKKVKRAKEEISNNANLVENVKELLEKMTTLEKLELIKACEEDWGVSAQAVAVASSDNSSSEKDDSEAEVKVGIVGFTDKMKSIKFVRKHSPDLGLMDANKAVTGSSETAPYELGTFEKSKADELIKEATEAGATAKVVD